MVRAVSRRTDRSQRWLPQVQYSWARSCKPWASRRPIRSGCDPFPLCGFVTIWRRRVVYLLHRRCEGCRAGNADSCPNARREGSNAGGTGNTPRGGNLFWGAEADTTIGDFELRLGPKRASIDVRVRNDDGPSGLHVPIKRQVGHPANETQTY